MDRVGFRWLFAFSFLFVVVMSVFVVELSTFSADMAENSFITGFVVHDVYSGFSAAEEGLDFDDSSRLVSVNDTIIYKTGYYSVNGSAWRQFNLSGDSYFSRSEWLRGSASYSLPELGSGEHYVIVYSCTYNSSNTSWDCHDNNWQLIVVNASADEGSDDCEEGEYFFEDVCLSNSSGNTYFVSVTGNDSWSGDFTHPWRTWSKAFYTAQAGDLVYFRGGIYYTEITDGKGIRYVPDEGLGHDGDSDNWIRYFAYPGEIPVLDCSVARASDVDGSWDVLNYGINLEGVDYVHIKGLHIKNVLQRPTALGEQADLCIGFRSQYSDHLKLENMDVSNVNGYAFRTITPYYAEIINCDAHDCIDIYHQEYPGQWGGGFGGGSEIETGYVYYYGCRAWNCSDQGFAGASKSLIIWDHCWSFDNGALEGEGIGFKIGYWSNPTTIDPVAILRNCISANSPMDGITGNENSLYTEPYHLYNNFVYNSSRHAFAIRAGEDSTNDTEELKRIVRNNIAYVYGTSACNAEPYNPATLYTHSNNSWDSPVTVTADDFVSLDTSQLYWPRKIDGSLPDITFGHLAEGSDLIDAGMDVGLSYSGSSPDMGAFEYEEVVASCVGDSEQSCSITNGVGTQSRLCSDGEWSSWSICMVVSCNSGYVLSGNSCVLNCTSNYSSACYGDDVYWYDSCGTRESIKYDCNSSQTCSEGNCTDNIVMASQIIADHTVVDRYDDIPQCWIDEVKKMWIVVPGESHSEAYREGLALLESLNSTYQVTVTTSGTPLAYTDQYLRISRATWGDLNTSSGWVYDYGEEDWYTSLTAVDRTKEGITYANTHNLSIAAMGFAWCYDIVGYQIPTGARDPVYGCYWFGDSKGGPEGNLAWGLDTGDYVLTQNSINMDTYLSATQGYVDYCESNGYPTKIFFTTGPIGTQTPYEPSYQGHIKHEYIRNYVAEDSSRILFDYADILSYDDNGSQTLLTWNGYVYPIITPTNLGDGTIGHIGSAGAVRLAKAQWWMLARIAGWDGVSADCN